MASERGRRRIERLLDETVRDCAQAICLLDEPLAISSELNMGLLMERVLSRREILKA